MRALRATVASLVLIACYFYYYYLSSTKCTKDKCFFSHSFEEAQKKFANAAARFPSAKLETREVVDGLSTQFLKFEGRADVVLLYFAGTHGVEGYAGSAAQLAVLNEFKHDSEKDPTVIFFHPLNPFGMKYFRRVNEDNIDLNRNCLDPEKFEERKNLPNIAGYEDFTHLFNPQGTNSALYNIFTVTTNVITAFLGDMLKTKRALVSAQYHDPEGVQYGGKEKSQSHRNVEAYLKENLDITKVKAIFLLDEHTGLGPYGVDTLLIAGEVIGDIDTSKIFKAESSGAGKVEGLDPEADGLGGGDVSAGYELTIGTTECYQKMFPFAEKSIIVTQEFGTIPTAFVGATMMIDNLNWLNDVNPTVKHAISTFAFRVKGKPWENEIIRRGRIVFFELWQYLTQVLEV